MAAQTSTALTQFGDAFSNERFFARLRYDFDVDGGESDDTIHIGQALANSICFARIHILTQCVGASSTLNVGVFDGDVDVILDTTDGAVANLTANAVLWDKTTADGFYMAADEYVTMDIETADWTAGKFDCLIWGYNAN